MFLDDIKFQHRRELLFHDLYVDSLIPTCAFAVHREKLRAWRRTVSYKGFISLGYRMSW